MSYRAFNFNPGPAALPLPVLEAVQADFLDFAGTGMSIVEISHRSPEYAAMHAQVKADMRELLGLADDYHVLFLGGGASTQFYTLPWNLLHGARNKADYIVTGTWSKKAAAEARRFGDVHVAFDAADEHRRFTRIPTADQLDLRDDAVYLHLTSNNTVAGTQFQDFPTAPDGTFLVADMSSDMLWRPFDANRFGLIYAGAQKNLGPAGVTIVIAHPALLEACNRDVPTMVSYHTHANDDSLFNTCPVFPIYVVGKVLSWLKDLGGLEAIERLNRAKADALYATIDGRPDFFRGPVERAARSHMNIVWRLPSEELEKRFVTESKAAGLVGLKGHRSVGGLRASLYNAVTMEAVETLIAFMQRFAKQHG